MNNSQKDYRSFITSAIVAGFLFAAMIIIVAELFVWIFKNH